MAPTYQHRPSPGSRLVSLSLSLAICGLIVLALIRLGMPPANPGEAGRKLVAISFRPPADQRARRSAAAKAARTQAKAAAVQRAVRQDVAKPPPVLELPPGFIKLSRSEMAAADISKMARRPAESGGAASASGQAAAGSGDGPGGARLYNAQWYREPTRAELVTYMPRRDVSGGWAMIACRTQEKFRVEDCRELGESPPGSGLARALRQASWQFLVRPPRLEGKPLIGAWVRIRFDFTRAPASEGADAGGS